MPIGLYLKSTHAPVKVGDTLTTLKGETFTVAERLGPSWRLGGAPVRDTTGQIRLPSEYGAYCTTED